MNTKTWVSGLFFGSSLLVNSVAAQEHQHEEHGSHTHGQAVLTFVLEGNEAELAFATPTANIVGFEHQAKDDAERQLVQKMIADFTAASWFSFGAEANCTVTGTDISSDLTAERTQGRTLQPAGAPRGSAGVLRAGDPPGTEVIRDPFGACRLNRR